MSVILPGLELRPGEERLLRLRGLVVMAVSVAAGRDRRMAVPVAVGGNRRVAVPVTVGVAAVA